MGSDSEANNWTEGRWITDLSVWFWRQNRTKVMATKRWNSSMEAEQSGAMVTGSVGSHDCAGWLSAGSNNGNTFHNKNFEKVGQSCYQKCPGRFYQFPNNLDEKLLGIHHTVLLWLLLTSLFSNAKMLKDHLDRIKWQISLLRKVSWTWWSFGWKERQTEGEKERRSCILWSIP